jgi:hypothetical protein
MDLDRALAQVEVAGDDLVRLAGHDQAEHLGLAWRQRLEPRADCIALAEQAPRRSVLPERLRDAVEQVLVPERFLDEIHRAGLHRLDGHWDVAMTRDEDDRQDRMTRAELLLQLEAAHAGHADVEHHAAGRVLGPRAQEIGTR